MTKVLQVLGRSAGGIAKHVAQITDALDAHEGLTVEVAGPDDLPIAIPNLRHSVSIPDGPLGHRKAVGELREIIEAGSYDVVHAHGLRAGIDAGRAAGATPSLVTVHNLVHPAIAGPVKAPLYRWAERLAVRSNDRTLCVSEQIAHHLRRQNPKLRERIEVTYLGIEAPPPPQRGPEEIRAELGVGDRPLVVTASRLQAQKQLHVMFDALKDIDADLAVLGEGPLRAQLEELAERTLGGRAHFLGFRDDVTDFIRAANVFCLSSVWEGVPLAAQEAILVGTPVVATAVGGMPELVEDGVSGRLVPAGDAAALRAALTDVLEDPARAEKLADNARRRLTDRFSKEKMLARLLEAYRDA